MLHEAKNFDHLIGQVAGIGEAQLKAHFGLYQGYVKKLNEIEDKLAKADPKGGNYSFNEFSELKRRESVAFNGAYLHQLYFENLSKPGNKADGGLANAIDAGFGSYDAWVAQLRGAATSTHGWVLLTYNKVDRKLHNYLVISEHHIGLPVHQEIILALDCWEHAYMIEYGTAKAKYLDAFVDNICWKTAGTRFAQAAG